MVVNIPKPDGEVLDSLNKFKNIFILGCGGCPIGCDSGGEERLNELADLLKGNDKKVTGKTLIDFLCNKVLVASRLRDYLSNLQETEAILVVSCGIGVQSTNKMVDLPALPANDTVSSQGMQGLWPSTERCAGCGTCYLAYTGGICPITTCSKSLINGMCGGQHDGKCEVEKDRDCGWFLIYNRLKEIGQLDNLKKIPRLRDYRKEDVPDFERVTTRWAVEKEIAYKAPKPSNAKNEGE